MQREAHCRINQNPLFLISRQAIAALSRVFQGAPAEIADDPLVKNEGGECVNFVICCGEYCTDPEEGDVSFYKYSYFGFLSISINSISISFPFPFPPFKTLIKSQFRSVMIYLVFAQFIFWWSDPFVNIIARVRTWTCAWYTTSRTRRRILEIVVLN